MKTQQILHELPDPLEKIAAALWTHENPEMSVFACEETIKSEYRARVLKVFESKP